MNTRECLEQARALIADPGRWTTRANARDAYGAPRNATEETAIQWCAVGALYKVLGYELSRHHCEDKLQNACLQLFGDGITIVNDDLGHAAILDAFDAAIAAEGQS